MLGVVVGLDNDFGIAGAEESSVRQGLIIRLNGHAADEAFFLELGAGFAENALFTGGVVFHVPILLDQGDPADFAFRLGTSQKGHGEEQKSDKAQT